jgi:hypothetical protein
MHCTVIASKLPGFTSGTKDGPDFYMMAGGRRSGVECTAQFG